MGRWMAWMGWLGARDEMSFSGGPILEDARFSLMSWRDSRLFNLTSPRVFLTRWKVPHFLGSWVRIQPHNPVQQTQNITA